MPAGPVDVAARARARLGSTLNGKFTLDRLLGCGGMAAVYAATHRNTKRFAVKVLHAELSVHADIRARFLREGYLANSVGHPGAVAVVDDEVGEDGSAFLVMELLEGETLHQIQRRIGPRLPARVVLAVADATLLVLEAAHARAIIHRDVKPANLLLAPSGQLKVLDFGVARMIDAAASIATDAGLALGTPWFMAPEQAMGQTGLVGVRTDIWSVGATMFELLTGRHVHEAGTPQEAMIYAATKPAPSLASVRDDLPVQVTAIVDRALAFTADARWPTARAMSEAVRAAFHELEKEPLTEAATRSVAVVSLEPSPPLWNSAAHSLPTADALALAAGRTPRPDDAGPAISSAASGVSPRSVQVILWEDIFAVVDDGRALAHEYAVLRDLIVEQAKRFRGGIGCLAIIPRTAKPPSEEARLALNAALQEVSGALRCICWLVEGAGFQGAMVRGVLTGLNFVARRSYATHVSTSMDEAITWMLSHLPRPERLPNDVERAREEIRKQRMDRGVAAAR